MRRSAVLFSVASVTRGHEVKTENRHGMRPQLISVGQAGEQPGKFISLVPRGDQKAPRLFIVRRRCPACGFEQGAEIVVSNATVGECEWAPAFSQNIEYWERRGGSFRRYPRRRLAFHRAALSAAAHTTPLKSGATLRVATKVIDALPFDVLAMRSNVTTSPFTTPSSDRVSADDGSVDRTVCVKFPPSSGTRAPLPLSCPHGKRTVTALADDTSSTRFPPHCPMRALDGAVASELHPARAERMNAVTTLTERRMGFRNRVRFTDQKRT